MNEMALLESPSLRRDFCRDENAAVLDKVGRLVTLPETGWAITKEVARFYEVPKKTVNTIVVRYRHELEEDGYKVLSKKEFEKIQSESFKVPNRGIAVFPRRAVLRVGMLLRDSPVAQKVRTYLLNREEESRQMPVDLSLILVHQVRMFSHLIEGQRRLADRIEKLERGT